MMGHDLIRPDAARHGALVMTRRAHPILRGEERITLRSDLVKRAKSGPVVKALVSDEDAPLLSALKAKRRALAEAAGLPAYMIFNDRTLIEMAETRPATLDAMARIGGVGAKKLESYGAAFLAVIAGEVPELHPQRRRLAGSAAGEVFDQLSEAQQRLARGADGTERLLRLSAAELRRIAEALPRNSAELGRLAGMNAAKLERFGDTFLEIVAQFR
jgi:ATP-dependent DNA helicase RecQ